jgi:hypothetical protein
VRVACRIRLAWSLARGDRLASWHAMSRSESSRFPVTVTRLPLTRCEICGRTLAYQPGQASAVLTKHYLRMHPEALSEAAESEQP